MDKKEKIIPVLSVLLVFISSWFIGNLMNMSVDSDIDPLLQSQNATFPDFVPTLSVVILFIPFLILAFVYYKSDATRKDVLNAMIIIGFWLFLLSGILLIVFLGGFPILAPISYFFALLLPNNFSSSISPFIFDFGLIILLVICGFFLSYLMFVKLNDSPENETETPIEKDVDMKRIEGFNKTDEEQLKQTIGLTLDRAISDLDRGEDKRTTVLKCYKEISNLLAEKGAENKKSMTPREFKRETIKKVPSVEKSITEITYLFEEARYSPHDLKIRDKEKVLKYLKKLKEDFL